MMRTRRVLTGAALGTFALLFASAGSYVAYPTTLVPEQTPVSTEVADASADDSSSSEDPSESEDPLFEQFEATAYCDFGITYSGVLVQRGIVAADPEVLPIGSVIEVIAGDYSGIYTVMDTGGVVRGKLIDIYVPDYEEAIQFGRQSVQVRVIRHGWHPEQTLTFEYTVAG